MTIKSLYQSAFKGVTHLPTASQAKHAKIRIYLLTDSIIFFITSEKDHFRNADLTKDRNVE